LSVLAFIGVTGALTLFRFSILRQFELNLFLTASLTDAPDK
jgi:hypothetical protein